MKKLISFILCLCMLLSTLGITALAVDAITVVETALSTTTLTMKFNQAIDTDCFSKTATVTDKDGGEVTFTVTPSADKKTFTLTFENALDVSGVYTLSFAYLYNTAKNVFLKDLSYELKFNIYLDEDFEAYETTEDLCDIYAAFDSWGEEELTSVYSKISNGTGWGGDSGNLLYSLDIEDNGNKRLWISGWCDNYTFAPKTSIQKVYYTLDYDVETTVTGHFTSDILANPAKDTDGMIGIMPANVRYNYFASSNGDAWVTNCMDPYANSSEIHVSIAKKEGPVNDTLSLSINGDAIFSVNNLGKLKNKDSFGLRQGDGASRNGAQSYIDNILIYNSEVTVKNPGTTMYAPTLSNAKVEGTFALGEQVFADYDTDADSSVATVVEWYRNDDYFAKFPDEWTQITDADGNLVTTEIYTIQEADLDNYIVCRVTQITLGDEEIVFNDIKSAPVYKISAPEAVGAELIKQGEDKLFAYFEYFDANSDFENGTTVVWEVSEDKETWDLGANVDVEDTTGRTYKITESDYDKYLKCTITVKNDAELGDKATPVVLNYTMPFKPVLENVKLKGGDEVGDILKVSYDYFDENGDKMTKVEVEWFKVKSGKETSISAKGLNYCVQKADAGYEIGVRLTPVNEGVSGDKAETFECEDLIKIEKVKTSSSSSSPTSSYRDVVGGTSTKPATFVPDPVEVVEPVSLFSDTKGHWAEKDIEEMAKAGLINGRGEGVFDPEAQITRAEWLALLLRGAGIALDAEYNNAYSDVVSTDWFAKDVQKAFDLKIIASDEGGFRGNDPATREEMAAFAVAVYEYKKSAAQEGDMSKFTDNAEITEAYKAAVAKAVGLGLMNGMDETTFGGKQNSTRAQAAVMLKRATGLLK